MHTCTVSVSKSALYSEPCMVMLGTQSLRKAALKESQSDLSAHQGLTGTERKWR